MTLTQIHSFLTAASFHSYTKAANELKLSVSAISRQISAIETELNVQLLKRDSKHFELTSCGEFFYTKMQELYNEYENAVKGTRQIYQGYNGTISIGIVNDITLYGPLKQCFEAFQRKYSYIHLDLERGSYDDMVNGIITRKYDCTIGPFFSLNQYDFLKYKILDYFEEGILISASHPLAKKDVFYPSDFRNIPFIIIESSESSYLMQGPVDYFRKNNITPPVIYAKNPDSATLMTEAGLGIAFSHRKSIGSYNPDLKFIPVPPGTTITNSPYLVLCWNEESINPALTKWLEVVSEHIRL